MLGLKPNIIRQETATCKRWVEDCNGIWHLSLNSVAICTQQVISLTERTFDIRFAKPCSICIQRASAGDFIIKDRINVTPWRSFKFPTIERCRQCSNLTGIRFGNVSINNHMIASQIMMIEYGFKTMQHWDNPPPSCIPCKCETEVPRLTVIFNSYHPKLDSGWLPTRAGACITDYVRTITFDKDLGNDIHDIVSYLQLIECPGWTPVHVKRVGNTEYQFSTTMDSSG